ncbi:Ras-specific guanine nucleotide-releasing factor RalGPS2 [Anabarilius grahami]|uniref:Ras-specific guanine nucleotide-releasing factor RalGPS2 n=1 Tax=Anabarilius grahami TaxID=495550 RepID=A0A3N0ZBE9_ANAGA|nr:Ras-specific guanine nucleotide-releasing factor RalGPS2 [Anabarilius grahami]
MHVASERLNRVVRSNRRTIVAQIAQEVNAGSDRKVSEYTVHHSLLRMGLHSRRPVRVPMLTPVHCRKRQQWAHEFQNWTTEQWKKVAWSGACIYLSDLTYIDSAYPSTGSILENEQRSNLMNNILRIISDLQRSCEYDIPVLPHVQKYLNSVRYIEELQKFVEDDNYKLSLKIEPPATSTPRTTASREDLTGPETSASPLCGRRGNVAEGALPKVPPTPPSPRNLITYGHRKCHSLGYNFIHKTNTVEFKSATFPNAGSRHLLDDSVLESHTPTRGQAESSTLSSGISLGSSEGSELSEEMSWPAFERTRFYHSLGPVSRVGRISCRGALRPSSSAESEELAVHLYPGAVTVQGVLRRKTVLKEGKKPTVAAWTKYWVALCGTQLYYYTAKSLKATERKHFKSTASKSVSVLGLMAMMADDPEHPDIFLLTDSEHGPSEPNVLRKTPEMFNTTVCRKKRLRKEELIKMFDDFKTSAISTSYTSSIKQ